MSLFVIVGFGLLDWLADGGGVYTSLMVLPLVHVAASHPPQRVALAFGTAVLALLPELAAHQLSTPFLVTDLVDIVLWLCLGGMALVWTAGVRWQRIALRHSEDQAQQRALHDPVTGLGNRRKLIADLGHALAVGSPTALALFDLNGFKTYNDTFGHPAGDALLVRLADRLDAAVAGAGAAYRMGGDEFVLLVDGQAPERVLDVGARRPARERAGIHRAAPREARSSSPTSRTRSVTRCASPTAACTPRSTSGGRTRRLTERRCCSRRCGNARRSCATTARP